MLNSIGCIGAGAMGQALVRGILSTGLIESANCLVADVDQVKLTTFAADIGARATDSLTAAQADVVILAVKPDQVPTVLAEIGAHITGSQLVLSIAAGVTLADICASLAPDVAVIRAMPNMACLVGQGAIGFSATANATQAQIEMAERILAATGVAVRVPEPMLDAVTGLSGLGPGYAFLMIEALADGGVAVGLPRDIALRLAAQTLLGAACLVLETGKHPGVLKDMITSPGGTTIAGLGVLEQEGMQGALVKAVITATNRSREIGAKSRRVD